MKNLSSCAFCIPGRFSKRKDRGFALVITLSLMVMLTILAVGLMSLSAVSMRTASRGDAMQTARGNARLALSMAIAQLQKHAGPDTRITAPANLVDDSFSPGITGAWRSWRPPENGNGDYESEKQARFLGYLMSDPSPSTSPDSSRLPGGNASGQLLVGPGSLGTNANRRDVRAPLISTADSQGRSTGALAWATLDEGVKGRIDLLPDSSTFNSEGYAVTRVGGSARNRPDKVDGMDFYARMSDDELRETLPKLVSYDVGDLMAGDRELFGRYFHDFSIASASVQADVASGGLKTDLSVLFDNNLPTDYANRYLYSESTSPLATSEPLWSLYANYAKLYRRTTANDNALNGMKAYLPSRYALTPPLAIANPSPPLSDTPYEPNMRMLTEPMLMPTVLRVDTVFTLITRDVHGGRSADLRSRGFPYMLHLMYLPVITLHNPYNVPLRFTEIEVEFADIPIGFQFAVNGQPVTNSMVSLNQLYNGNENGTNQKVFKMTLTGDLNRAVEVVMGPGETRVFGKPFPSDWSWTKESAGTGADGTLMFDWRNDKTGLSNRVMPGMITGQNDGVGYDCDWLAPGPAKASWLSSRTGEGVVPLAASDTISVSYGPKILPNSKNKFSVVVRLKNGTRSTNAGATQVFFRDEGRLKAILEEGTSPRFTEVRSFPETFPKSPRDAPIRTMNIYEANSTPVSEYAAARPFAIFSLGAKTTQEAFTRSRPVADTGITMQMATCDFGVSASQGSSPLEFILTPVRSGSSVIESDGVKGYFFGGHGGTLGSTSATFYEIPLAPLQSLAQLRHANGASLGSAPYFTYSIGESRAHPALPPGSTQATKRIFNANKILLDHSWLANDRLWDKYWFSTLSTLEGPGFSGASSVSQSALAREFFAGARQLPNPRNLAYRPPGVSVDDAVAASLDENGVRSAAHILTKGGFNVNSVSLPAWISVLSSLCDSEIPLASSRLENSGNDIPFLRTRRPTLGLEESAGVKENDRLWNSYRRLDRGQVETLANLIVEEIRERGPFLSMSDFVNRRLSGDDDYAIKGALQAAIDKSGFNRVMEANAFSVTPGDVAEYGWQNSKAVEGNTGAGAPGEISQGDILSAIGAFISVRSDTFRIRAYGDARDADGSVIARAWCEATVQRLPEYVDQNDPPEIAPVSAANQIFGRRFSIVAFRWLGQDEV